MLEIVYISEFYDSLCLSAHNIGQQLLMDKAVLDYVKPASSSICVRQSGQVVITHSVIAGRSATLARVAGLA